MGIELGKIHSYRTFDFFGEWDENGNSIGNVNQYMVFFQSYAESCAAEIHMQQLPERNLLDRAILFLRDNYSVMKGIKESRLCHNDFNGRNVIVEESLEGWKVKGIIDFEQCVPGNREIDIAMLYHTYFLNDSSLERAFLKGYSRYLNIEREFYSRLNYYLLYIGVYICSWAYARAPEYYMEGIELIKSLQDILHF
jgi:Ser/Thr protein kinase RdoA (MazF antagonist)